MGNIIDFNSAPRLDEMQNPTPSPAEDPSAEFAAALIQAGFAPGPITSQKLVRCPGPGDKPGRKNGWYIFYDDWPASGAYGSWKDGEASFNWCGKADLSPEEKQIISRRAEANRRMREEDLARTRKESEARAGQIIGQAAMANPEHPYLSKKQILPHQARQQDNNLILPLFDINGALKSLQFIKPDGEKRFLSGGAKKGCFCPLGPWPPQDKIIIAEGFATAATVQQASGLTCLVAFDAGNLEPVAMAIKQAYPGISIIVAADNDHTTEGNPGKTKGEAAASAVGGKMLLPEPLAGAQATDWNDVACALGMEAVRAKFNELLTARRSKTNTAAEILSASYPNNDFIHGLAQRQDSILLWGKSGIGKSILEMNIALTMASGGKRKLWDKFLLASEQPYQVLIVQSEMGARATQQRLQLMVNGCPEYKEAMDNIHFLASDKDPVRGLGNLEEDAFREDLMANIVETRADLVILDPLVSYHLCDENDNAKMRAVLELLSNIQDATQATFLVVHHAGKGNVVASGAEGSRGASSIGGWTAVDINFAMMPFKKRASKKNDDEFDFNEAPTQEDLSREFLLTFGKVRNFVGSSPIKLRRNEFLIMEVVEEKKVVRRSPDDEKVQVVVEVLREMGGRVDKQKDLVVEVGLKINKSEPTAKNLVYLAQDLGLIEMTKERVGRSTVTGYRLPGLTTHNDSLFHD